MPGVRRTVPGTYTETVDGMAPQPRKTMFPDPKQGANSTSVLVPGRVS